MHERCWFIDLQPDIAHTEYCILPCYGIWCKYHIDNNSVNMFGEQRAIECREFDMIIIIITLIKHPENGEQRKPYVYAFFFQLLRILHTYCRIEHHEPIYLCYA